MMKTGQDVPDLSVQHAMICNFLNEGCQGGWPEMNGYYFEQGASLVEESCGIYIGE